MEQIHAEQRRLFAARHGEEWKKWGPYVADRQWATVREDYSENGSVWEYINHDRARSYAYRWGEDGIAGFSNNHQILCIGPVFWNGKDPILKERLFGLTNWQGNHGEDVKELYFHLAATPTYSYCKFLYKYPIQTYPYQDLIEKNQRSRAQPEFEVLETGVFNHQRYFDCFIEYAKGGPEDILLKITVFNRSRRTAMLHILPHLWFRNYWKHNAKYNPPKLRSAGPSHIQAQSIRDGGYWFYHEEGTQLFCDNETNSERLFQTPNDHLYPKDGIHDHVVYGLDTVNPELRGTKAAVWIKAQVPGQKSYTVRIRLSKKALDAPWQTFDAIFNSRIQEADEFYQNLLPPSLTLERLELIRQTYAGLLWSKQFYYLDVFQWLFGEPGSKKVPERNHLRNFDWQHLTNRNVISMPDKWEYPWYAAWDLAFHTVAFSTIDIDFAKEQLLLILREYYMHPNGQIPAYEWNFSDVNPPVHSWAVWQVYIKDKTLNNHPDLDYLERAFQKLLINFTWWVNQKDVNGIDLFEGGFLGLDNIGVFDRNHMPPGIKKLQQADATSWMALFALNMLRMSLELAQYNPSYEESAAKFFRHFLNIAWAMHHIGKKDISLWDDEDAFYYDVVQLDNGTNERMRVRSLVGIIPLFAVEVMHKDLFKNLDEFNSRAITIVRTRPDLASLISRIEEDNKDGYYLFSIMRGFRLEHLLKRLLDEEEFLSDYGIRSLSKFHQANPFIFEHHGQHSIHYEPGESSTNMFGGNSNWRGPIWLPINYLIIQSLREYYTYYGPTYLYEFPTGSGNKLNLKQIAIEISKRLLRLFELDDTNKYTYHNDDPEHHFATDPHFKGLHLFYEFFHGDSGRGMGASHQTGWTALIANILLEMEEEEALQNTETNK